MLGIAAAPPRRRRSRPLPAGGHDRRRRGRRLEPRRAGRQRQGLRPARRRGAGHRARRRPVGRHRAHRLRRRTTGRSRSWSRPHRRRRAADRGRGARRRRSPPSASSRSPRSCSTTSRRARSTPRRCSVRSADDAQRRHGDAREGVPASCRRDGPLKNPKLVKKGLDISATNGVHPHDRSRAGARPLLGLPCCRGGLPPRRARRRGARALARVPRRSRGSRSAELAARRTALGRVTAAPVWALRSSPAFDASAMDGIAVRAADTLGRDGDSPRRCRRTRWSTRATRSRRASTRS